MPLHPYQKRAARFLYHNPCSGFFADPGAGKTLTVLAVLHKLKKLNPELKTLIIAPLRVCQYVWPAEIEKWGFPFTTHFIHGKSRTVEHSGADIELVNPEGLKWLTGHRAPTWDVLVVDESSQFKNGRSVRFKLLKPWLGKIPRRHVLTGTPSPRSYLDLWSQIYLLDQGATLGRFITHYRQRFFSENRFRNFSEWTIRPGAESEIQRLIAPLIYRVEAELDMPELVENKIIVELDAKAKRVYKDMEKKLAAEIDGEQILTPTAATKYQACCQIASGALYDASRNVHLVHDAKLSVLKDLISELQGKPLLIGFRYRHESTRLREALKCAIIDGSTSKAQTDKYITDWNAGTLPVLAAQARTISHGLNLQGGGCHDVCWFSLTDDYERFDQFNRRVYRQGITGAYCRIHYLIARDTVDTVILARNRSKERRQKSLLDYLRDYIHTVQ